MPIWLRKFTYHKIEKFYKKEKQEHDKANNKGKTNLLDSDGKVNTPKFMEASKQYKGKSSYK